MPSRGLKNICEPLGISSRQLAWLLMVSQSQLSMAAGGFRPVPVKLQPWMRLLEQLAVAGTFTPHSIDPVLSAFNTGRRKVVSKQIRVLKLEATRLQMRLERATFQLDKTEKCCTWLPVLLQSSLCIADADRSLATTVLLRQAAQKREAQWLEVQTLRAKLTAVDAALAYWKETDLSV